MYVYTRIHIYYVLHVLNNANHGRIASAGGTHGAAERIRKMYIYIYIYIHMYIYIYIYLEKCMFNI